MAFPNVPNAPGVPALARSLLSSVPGIIPLLTSDSPSLFAGLDSTLWGLFIDGEPAVVAESVVSFEYRKGYTIATFPVEKGGFESYDKVERPFDVRLQFSTGGSPADRQALLDSVDAAVKSLDLFDAATPLKTYPSVNPTRYDYRQTSVNGVGLLVVDVHCEQVRVTATSSFTNGSQQNDSSAASAVGSGATTGTSGTGTVTITPTASWSPRSPSAASRVSDGTVQTTPAAAGQLDLSQALP